MPRASYAASPEPPHAPLPVLQRRLAARLPPPDPQGCQLWQRCGEEGPAAAVLRVRTPTGSALLPAHKVAWHLAGHPWVRAPDQLLRTCGQALCCAPGHLAHRSADALRGLSDEQVTAARAAYWGQGRKVRGKLARRRVANPAQHTAWELGVARETVQRALAGEPVRQHLWGSDVTAARVAEVYADKVRLCARLERLRAGALTMHDIARQHRVSLTCMSQAINGVTYRHLPMPAPGGQLGEEEEDL